MATIAAFLKTSLCRGAADIRIALNAESAMAILESFVPALVVPDYGLPGIDGDVDPGVS